MEENEKKYELPDVYSYLVDLKNTKVSELIRENEDGTYTVLLNSRFTHEQNRSSYQHAIQHILREDFAGYDVQSIEAEAHEEKKSRRPEK